MCHIAPHKEEKPASSPHPPFLWGQTINSNLENGLCTLILHSTGQKK